MASRIFTAARDLEWKKAYMAAIEEKDRTLLPGLILDAKGKLSERLRELWRSGPVPCEELEAIDDALYLLQALLNSMSHRDEMDSWNRSNLDS